MSEAAAKEIKMLIRTMKVVDAARSVVSENQAKLKHARASRSMIALERALRDLDKDT
jgi:hypothetical protein